MPAHQGRSGGKRTGDAPRSLSAREREVLGLLAEGMSGAAIAEQLVLSPETVRTHVRNAMDKLGASTRSQAVALALELGHIGDPAPDVAPVRKKRPARLVERADSFALDRLVGSIGTLPDVTCAGVYLADESGLLLRLESRAPQAECPLPEEATLGDDGIGRVALERRTQLVALGSDGTATPVMGAPLVREGRLAGVLCVAVRPSRPVTRREMLLLEAFAGRVGDVLATGTAPVAQLERMAQRFRASWTGALAG